jgi:hypothetical protein
MNKLVKEASGVVPSSPWWYPDQYAQLEENNFQSAEAEKMPLGQTTN